MVYSHGRATGSPPQLPSLGTDKNGSNGDNPQSAWLRGNAHPKVPEITNQPLNTMLQKGFVVLQQRYRLLQ